MHCGKRQRLNILSRFVVVVVFYFHLKTFFLQFCFVHGFLVKRVDKNSLKKNSVTFSIPKYKFGMQCKL